MIRFKDIPKEEKPRERLVKYGEKYLSNEELLCILLKTGTKKYNVKEVANNLLYRIGNIKKLKEVGINTLKSIEGIGDIKAIELKAMIELGRRIYQEENIEKLVCTNALSIYKYFNPMFKDIKQEEFYCLYLDTKKKFISKKKLFVGSINKSIVHPREIFKEAYLLSSSFIVCLHNHPSGDPNPSKEDIILTQNILELGYIHGIYLIDHIIIGNNKYFSFYENGYINNRQ